MFAFVFWCIQKIRNYVKINCDDICLKRGPLFQMHPFLPNQTKMNQVVKWLYLIKVENDGFPPKFFKFAQKNTGFWLVDTKIPGFSLVNWWPWVSCICAIFNNTWTMKENLLQDRIAMTNRIHINNNYLKKGVWCYPKIKSPTTTINFCWWKWVLDNILRHFYFSDMWSNPKV